MKLAHIHRPKCSGVFVNSYFRVKVYDPRGWRIQNSWKEIHRDWSAEELETRLTDPDPHHFVTNHTKNWTRMQIVLARENGFKTFMWGRHPGDLLCSYFFFHMKEFKHLANKYPKLGIPIEDFHKWPLDNWLRHALDDPTCECEIHKSGKKIFDMFAHDGWFDWGTPDWWREVDVYRPFTDQNFQWFLREHCNMGYHEWPKRNTSCNAGWQRYVDEGAISPRTVEMLMAHTEWHQWIKLTEMYPLD